MKWLRAFLKLGEPKYEPDYTKMKSRIIPREWYDADPSKYFLLQILRNGNQMEVFVRSAMYPMDYDAERERDWYSYLKLSRGEEL